MTPPIPEPPEPLVYLNGDYLPASRAALPIYDAGIVLGATVTEMTRTFAGGLFRLEDHLDRLGRALKYTRMDPGLTRESWRELSHRLVEHHRTLQPEAEIGLIHFVTAGQFSVYAGSAARANLTPTVCAHTFPLPFELWAEKLRSGQHLVTPSIRHVPPQCYDPKMKYRSRMHYFLADQEARLVDPDAAALLLDLDGNVTETSGANFLAVIDGAIVSPTLRNILPGISRDTVRQLAGTLNIPFLERDLQLFDVVNAQEAWTCSTPYCLAPVVKINGIPIGNGRPGPMFRRLLDAWSLRVGVDIWAQVVRSHENQ